ncbi:MAG: putative bifunctional diguanylate cyclase/phosphodiesterase, partial [Janthinobacterium lividum]
WRRRHRWVCAVLFVHVLLVPVYGLLWHLSVVDALGFGATLLVFLAAAQFDDLRCYLADDPTLPAWAPQWMRSCAAALGLVVASGEIVQISDGWTEAHFHFFVMVPVVAVYEAWAPFALAAGYVLFQHGIVGTLFPTIVFHAGMAHTHPWLFALVHAGLFAATCVASLSLWRLAEASRVRQENLLEQMQHRALHDLLTGLPNRASLHAMLEDELNRHPDVDVAVLMIDLDRFKEVNDTLGHACGDDLLRQVSVRLSGAVRDGDLLARLGGDEFAVVLPGSSARDARVVAERLRQSLAGELVVADVAVDVDASIGIASRSLLLDDEQATRPGLDHVTNQEIEALLRQADIAMYAAKERGIGIALYDPRDDANSAQRLSTLSDLRAALFVDDELFLHYLTKVDVTTGRIEGIEALLRWRHPRRGLLLPAAFVPLVENTALAEPLTNRVLSMALHQVGVWNSLGHRVEVSVNVPARCLRPHFVENVLHHLTAADVPTHQLRLEITESALLTDPHTVAEVLIRLRQAGIHLSVDDFGTGSSSLTTLRSLPVDELKIDRSFVSGLASDDPLARRADEVLVRSLVQIAHGLSLRIVAEGVETAEIARAVANAGCDLAQGFHYSPPASAADVTSVLLAARTARA